jgi:hypothetical protein
LFPHHARPTYASYITWRAVVPAEAARGIAPHPGVVETWGDTDHVKRFRCSVWAG